jgi:hypothetical protein
MLGCLIVLTIIVILIIIASCEKADSISRFNDE